MELLTTTVQSTHLTVLKVTRKPGTMIAVPVPPGQVIGDRGFMCTFSAVFTYVLVFKYTLYVAFKIDDFLSEPFICNNAFMQNCAV